PLPPPIPTLFPYTTLFRSRAEPRDGTGGGADGRPARIPGDHRPGGVRGGGAQHAAPHSGGGSNRHHDGSARDGADDRRAPSGGGDRKSTRLNSSHVSISYA